MTTKGPVNVSGATESSVPQALNSYVPERPVRRRLEVDDSSSDSDWQFETPLRASRDTKTRSSKKDDKRQRMLCEVCLSATAADVMTLEDICGALKKVCDTCHRCVHVYCSCYPLPDDMQLSDEMPARFCQFCTPQRVYNHETGRSSDKDHRILDMRATLNASGNTQNPVEYFSTEHSTWVEKARSIPRRRGRIHAQLPVPQSAGTSAPQQMCT
ncbi:hypothetical protein SARC_02074 [Sphaeroforma arctica JP610]|uniref:Uncharacterized protein n=1 Tax=Sphaeroforma arctica JP610 TaxID=667725 RepID=A0A0L0G9U2_9EUKA|nr:hypothetical protein SARC_02074 [Sphaeroforma arctica JP610]KNC85770.1 hypothetical protein SARC_02074 [Sphaeroforma arctica JP610]|eukprot:XP_014159672.1 hypothetical protein SARC_02074 [Sphaeroforma arctica JP610]